MPLRTRLTTTFYNSLDPKMRAAIARVTKQQQVNGGATASYLQSTYNETIWLPSTFEVFGLGIAQLNQSEALSASRFQYQAFQGNGSSTTNIRAMKRYYGVGGNPAAGDVPGNPQYWFLRSAGQLNTHAFGTVTSMGVGTNSYANGNLGVVPCFAM